MTRLDKKFNRFMHLFILYPLAALGALIVSGIILITLDAEDVPPPELICTPGFPCYERFD